MTGELRPQSQETADLGRQTANGPKEKTCSARDQQQARGTRGRGREPGWAEASVGKRLGGWRPERGLCTGPPVWPQANYLTSLRLSFLIGSCITGGFHEKPVRQLGGCRAPRKGWGLPLL